MSTSLINTARKILLNEEIDNQELLESSLSRIQRKISKHTSGTISAFRDEYSRKENLSRNKEMGAYLRSKGYSVTKIVGSWEETLSNNEKKVVNEESFFVANQKVEGDDKGELENDLMKLGKKYDQDSILMIPSGGKDAYLVGTSNREDAFPGKYGTKMKIGSAKYGKVMTDIMSKIRGRPFALESVQEWKDPRTQHGMMGMRAMAKEVEKSLTENE